MLLLGLHILIVQCLKEKRYIYGISIRNCVLLGQISSIGNVPNGKEDWLSLGLVSVSLASSLRGKTVGTNERFYPSSFGLLASVARRSLKVEQQRRRNGIFTIFQSKFRRWLLLLLLLLLGTLCRKTG